MAFDFVNTVVALVAGTITGTMSSIGVFKGKVNGMGKAQDKQGQELKQLDKDTQKKDMCGVIHEGVRDKLTAIHDSQIEQNKNMKKVNEQLLIIARRPCQKKEGCDQ